LNCVNNSLPETTDFTFSLVDVGQGLSQIAIVDSKAVVWDMGPPESYPNWLRQYIKLGSPYIEAIAVSHTDLDHCGGLQRIDSLIKWSGILISSPYEDTAFLRRYKTG
jgi:beta-lactamase superfamily II metal-dependent hydrolase